MAARLNLDTCERKLIKLFTKGSIDVRTLDVGDVLCEYDDGSGWVAERKTVDDLAISIQDGRCDEQRDCLFKTGLAVVYIVEGDVASACRPELLGAFVNLELLGVQVGLCRCRARPYVVSSLSLSCFSLSFSRFSAGSAGSYFSVAGKAVGFSKG